MRAAALAAAQRLPLVQQRTFIPPSINSKAVIEEKYPDDPILTDAEDPGMVRVFPGIQEPRGVWVERNKLTDDVLERRLHQPSQDQATVPRPSCRLVG